MLVLYAFNMLSIYPSIRQITEKRREFRKDLAFDFVYLEKAFDTVPRGLAFAVMRWMEVGEAEVRMVGLRMTLEKTEVMWIGVQEEDLHVLVDGKTIK